jgi:uncharacterized protein (TIGR03663 family)
MSKAAFRMLFLAALIAGLAFRFGRLDARPMHHDEANQAVKFGTLLETGEYRYDPGEHHGPTLYYLTLPSAWARGQVTLTDLDEETLRAVPAAFGAGLILLLLVLTAGLKPEAVVLSAVFAAVSPALTYYSRFYIQESLFAFFTLGFLIALGRYALQPGAGWALLAGIFAGLAYATKETAVISLGAAGTALLLSLIWTKRILRHGHGQEGKYPDPNRGALLQRFSITHILAGLVAAVFVAVVFYSSFFTNPGGAIDSARALTNYMVRGIEPELHVQPWYYYVKLLALSASGGVVWTEGMILILSLAGGVLAFRQGRRNRHADPIDAANGVSAEERFWPVYLFFYSLIASAAFSVLRYKTPWNMLAFYPGFVVMAGSGAAGLLKTLRLGFVRSLFLVLLVAGVCHLGVQSWRANFVYPADPRNPYVYAQTSPDLLRLVKRVHDLTALHPGGKDMLLKVVAGPYEQWPLPWYLRDLRHVGYWNDASQVGGFDGVPVVIASQENARLLDGALGDRYQSEFYGLRGDAILTMYVDRGLWQQFMRGRSR